MMTMIEKSEHEAISPRLGGCCELRALHQNIKSLASGEVAGAQKTELGQTFPSKKNPCGNNSDQRDYLEIGLTTSRTASLGPEIRSAEPWLLLPITQDDSCMLTTYELTNLIY